MTNLKAIALGMLLAAVVGQAWSASTLFYTVAHQDDWQLFMSPNAFYDARVPDARVVFIYTTAGDAGHRTEPIDGQIVPYFRAREIGAIEAARFIATPSRLGCEHGLVCYDDFAERLRSRFVPIGGIGGRWLRAVSYRNTVSYFLRLPDGNPSGGGYDAAGNGVPPNVPGGNGSLQRLWLGLPLWDGAPALTDVQDRYSYTAAELIETLEGIIRREARGSSNVWVNIPYLHASIPGDDHSDHVYTGRFMAEAAKAFSCVNIAQFRGYETGDMAPNLTTQQIIWNAGAWGATNSGLLRTDGAKNTFNDPHNVWLDKRYFDVFPGSGPCTAESF